MKGIVLLQNFNVKSIKQHFVLACCEVGKISWSFIT